MYVKVTYKFLRRRRRVQAWFSINVRKCFFLNQSHGQVRPSLHKIASRLNWSQKAQVF